MDEFNASIIDVDANYFPALPPAHEEESPASNKPMKKKGGGAYCAFDGCQRYRQTGCYGYCLTHKLNGKAAAAAAAAASVTAATSTDASFSAPTSSAGRGRPKNNKRKAAKDAAEAAAAAASDKKQRKQARVSGVAPPSIDLNTRHIALNNFDAPTIAQILSKNNSEQIGAALNGLLRASADVDANFCLGPGGEKVVLELVKLFDEAIGWEETEEEKEEEEEEDDSKRNVGLVPTVKTWDASCLSGKDERWRIFCRDKLASPLASSSDPNLLIDYEVNAKILDIIIAIMRNLSFVAQNLRFLYHTNGVVRVLTGALYYRGYASGGGTGGEGGDDASSPHNSNMCIHSLQTLINLAPIIDITGRQLFVDRMFLESDAKEVTSTVPGHLPSGGAAMGTVGTTTNEKYGISSVLGFGGLYLAKQYDVKAETLDSIPDSFVWGLVGNHVRSTLAIFPALAAILDPNDITTTSRSMSGWHRPSVQALLEFLTVLIENPDNKGIFLCVPDSMLHRLTDMLYIPRLGPESMEYLDPISNTVSRIMPHKLMAGYDATIDSDMRDRACDLLVKLTDLSTGIKRRLGMSTSISGMTHRQCDSADLITHSETSDGLTPSILRSDETSSSRRMNIRLYDGLISMVSTNSGRGDAGHLAVRLLSNLALIPENKAGIQYVERKLILQSGKDPNIAKIACNGIFNRVK